MPDTEATAHAPAPETATIYVVKVSHDDSPQDDYEHAIYSSESDARNRTTPEAYRARRGTRFPSGIPARAEPFLVLCERGDHVAEAAETGATEAADEVRRERENEPHDDAACTCDDATRKAQGARDAENNIAWRNRYGHCPYTPADLAEARANAIPACAGTCAPAIAYAAETERLAEAAAQAIRDEYARDFVRVSSAPWRHASAAYVAFPDRSPREVYERPDGVRVSKGGDFDTAEKREAWAANLYRIHEAIEDGNVYGFQVEAVRPCPGCPCPHCDGEHPDDDAPGAGDSCYGFIFASEHKDRANDYAVMSDHIYIPHEAGLAGRFRVEVSPEAGGFDGDALADAIREDAARRAEGARGRA